MKTLQREFPSVKHTPPSEEQTDIVYMIPCKDCPWNLGETGRSLKTRKSEHVRNVKLLKDGSNIAKHAWDNNHLIDFESAKVVDKGSIRNRLTLESWRTRDKNANNNTKPLPPQYRALINRS